MPPLIGDARKPGDWIKPVKGKWLTFCTTGQEKDFTLVPYHRLFDERYVVCWRVCKKDSPGFRQMLERRTAEATKGKR